LTPGFDQEIYVIGYHALTSPPAVIPLEFCDSLGSRPVIVVVVHNGQSHYALTTDGSISVVPATFIRGDCNADGNVDLADVIFLGLRLFTAESFYPCREACESNGDGAVDIADMIYIANFLFLDGPPPAEPFPDCGEDSSPGSGFGCVEPPDCI
jgi:hypothetical protein